MTITKDKIMEKILQKETRQYYIEYECYDPHYYPDYCDNGYPDCECERCLGFEYTTALQIDALGNSRILCIPAGKEWFRNSQIDKLLNQDIIEEPLGIIHSKLLELGLVA